MDIKYDHQNIYKTSLNSEEFLNSSNENIDVFKPQELKKSEEFFNSSSDNIQSYILNRDKGLYDNLPYAYKKGPSKKNLYDFFSNVNSKVDIKISNKKVQINSYSSFLKGIELQLDAKLTGLFIEVSGEISTNSVALGGAAIFAKTNNANVIKQILNQIDDLIIKIQAKISTTYISNLTLYVKTYFQTSGVDEMAKINSMKFNKISSFDAYKMIFSEEISKSEIEQGTYSQEFSTLPSIKEL